MRIIDTRQRSQCARTSRALRKVPLVISALSGRQHSFKVGRNCRRTRASGVTGDTAGGEPLADNPLDPIVLLFAGQLSPPCLLRRSMERVFAVALHRRSFE
jgi:hypothetical protein